MFILYTEDEIVSSILPPARQQYAKKPLDEERFDLLHGMSRIVLLSQSWLSEDKGEIQSIEMLKNDNFEFQNIIEMTHEKVETASCSSAHQHTA
jgi:hypothetical protein